MVQRKDSLCYVEFVRGKYDLDNRKYLIRLFERMTRQERERLDALSFDELWFGFWQTDHSRVFMRDLNQAREKFEQLKRGYYLRDAEGKLEFFDLKALLRASSSLHEETEWGFPKGRRNINEKDLVCALREFREETGIDTRDIHVHSCAKPVEEVFVGCNRVRYRHVYYIAQLKQDGDAEAEDEVQAEDVRLAGDRGQLREVSRVSWIGHEGAAACIRAVNAERRDMFRRVHHMITHAHHMHALRYVWDRRLHHPHPHPHSHPYPHSYPSPHHRHYPIHSQHHNHNPLFGSPSSCSSRYSPPHHRSSSPPKALPSPPSPPSSDRDDNDAVVLP